MVKVLNVSVSEIKVAGSADMHQRVSEAQVTPARSRAGAL